jgi:hypothetical protein
MLPALEERLELFGLHWETNLSTMTIRTPQLDSQILLHSGQAAEGITGFEVGRTWIDEPARIPEYADHKRNVWLAAIGRTRSPHVPPEARKVLVTGTHEGKGTWVYRRWEKQQNAAYCVYRARTGENPSSREQEALYLAEYGPELAEQYVYGGAVEDSMAAIPYETIEAMQDGAASEGSIDSLKTAGGPLFVGIDIGRKQSLTVIWVVRASEATGSLLTVAVIVLRQAEFADQANIIGRVASIPTVQTIAIDATYNPQTAEDATRAHGGVIESVVFTPNLKRELFQRWIKFGQERKLLIPRSDEIVMDFFSMKRVVSQLGVVSYAAPMSPDGHADRATAAALAVWAARGGVKDYRTAAGPPLRSRGIARI